MSRITVELDSEDQMRLQALLAALHLADPGELVRQLINERFAQIQAEMTIVERKSGHPSHLLNGDPSLSERATRKAIVLQKTKSKAVRRKST